MNTNYLAKLTILTFLSALGCGGQPGDMPEVGTVQGTITLDGKPVAGASISFYPLSGGRSSSGLSDDDGKYSLQYSPQVMGAKVGENEVTISTLSEDDLDAGDPQNQTGQTIPGESPGRAEEIPEKYRTGEKMRVTVQPGDNVIDLTLTR